MRSEPIADERDRSSPSPLPDSPRTEQVTRAVVTLCGRKRAKQLLALSVIVAAASSVAYVIYEFISGR